MTRPLERARLVIAVLLFGALPFVALYFVFHNAAGEGKVTDYENAFHAAAEAIVDGTSPYPSPDDPALALGTEYVYPPLTALASIPLTLLSAAVAGVVVMALLALAVAGILWLLGVRDWRCYGLAFLWPPVISAIQTGNVTIPIALGAALMWRFRDDARVAGASLGLTLAAKLFLWPLLVWLGFTRRMLGAAIAVVVAVGVLLVTWGAIGFAGLGEYPDLLSRIQDLEEREGYTVFALAVDLGAPDLVARVVWIGLAVTTLAGVVVLGRRRDDTRAFALAVAAALAFSPIVWLHYFALLLVVVAVAEPRLGVAWFVPLAMYGSTGTMNGTTFQTTLTIIAAVATVAVALRPARPASSVVLAPTSPAGGRP